MGRNKTRRLTAEQFDAVMYLITRMSNARRAAARSALVDGRTAQSVASEYGWRRSAVHNAETVVWRGYERYLAAKKAEALPHVSLPRGWVRRTIVAPRESLEKFERYLAELLKAKASQ